jgi:hypothetical protein
MNLSDKIKFVLLFILALNTLIPAQDSCKAAITIDCDIPNVILSFNGNEFEQSNQFVLQLKKGIYKITLMENSDRLDAKTIYDTINVDDCDPKYFKYFFNEEVFLDSKPQDAKIISGDSLLGYTPLFINKDLASFLISKDGFESLSIRSDQLTGNNIFNLKFIGSTKKESFFETLQFKIILGAVAVLGGVTAYYKLLADDNYDDYKFTGSQASLDLTKKYDLISGISFGLLQLNFGYLLYNVFTE